MLWLAEALASPPLTLLIERPSGFANAPQLDAAAAALGASGWCTEAAEEHPRGLALPSVLLFGEGCSDDRLRDRHGEGEAVDLAGRRCLLRATGPESATPGLNWALGYDAVRVLEVSAEGSRLDWLLSVDEEELEDIRERIECGVTGEAFRKYGAAQTEAPLQVRVLGTEAVALPECCRDAAIMGALPPTIEVLWRVRGEAADPSQVPAARLDRWLAQAPFWVTASTAAEAIAASRALPRGAVWLADLRRARDSAWSSRADLRAAGAGGLALSWDEAGSNSQNVQQTDIPQQK